MTRGYFDAWKGVQDHSVLMTQSLVDGHYTPMGLITDWWSLGLRFWEAALGREPLDDDGLNFDVDDEAEAAGPRYDDLPAGTDESAIALSQVAHEEGAGRGTLTKANVMVRVEEGRLAVSLVELKSVQPLRVGTYRLTIKGLKGGRTIRVKRPA
jgi:hypothetical protein